MLRAEYPAQIDEMTNDVSVTSIKEMEIALSYLRKRFSEYSMDEVMLSLVQHLEAHPSQPENITNTAPYPSRVDYPEDNQPQFRRTRITHHNRDQRELR